MLWVVIGHSPLSVTAFASSFDADCHECALFLIFFSYAVVHYDIRLSVLHYPHRQRGVV